VRAGLALCTPLRRAMARRRALGIAPLLLLLLCALLPLLCVPLLTLAPCARRGARLRVSDPA
jgi:hypothetical protein